MSKHLHRIEVERDENGEVEGVRFICDGDDAAPCHTYPDCGCEQWSREVHGVTAGEVIGIENGHLLYASETIPPQPGHEPVQQSSCWVDPWFNEAIGNLPGDWIDAYDGEGSITFDDLRSGPIDTTWEGDYMTWEYLTAKACR